MALQSLFRGARKHLPVWARIASAALGVAILVAVGIGTARRVRGCYAGIAKPSGLTVHVPTKPFGELPATDSDADRMEAQYLVHFIMAEVTPAGVHPLAVQEVHLNWPEDRGYCCDLSLSGASLTFVGSLCVGSVGRPRDDGEHGPGLRGAMSYIVRRRHPVGSGSATGSLLPERVLHCLLTWPKGLLSTARRAGAATCILQVITPAASDDPLAVVPVEELLAQHEQLTGPAKAATCQTFAQGAVRVPSLHASAGEALARHLDTTFVLLLAAAALIALALPLRPFVTVAALLAVVLFAVALDRAALAYHLARLDNGDAATADRLTACAQMTDTFFFRQTALEHVEAVSEAEDSPAELRSFGETVASILREEPIN